MAYTTINKPGLHFNSKLFTGTGSSNAVTGVGFNPDLVWIKDRGTTYSHTWTDKVRGTSKELYSNGTAAEVSYSQGVTSFDSDGFTVGTDAGVNSNGGNKVSWNWKAGNSAGSSNSNGTITSTVSVNTTAGFSIATYTGNGQTASFGHGLSTPDIVLIKDRTDAGNEWYFHTTAIDGSEDYLRLNSNTTKSDASSGYSIGASVFNLGGAGSWVNVNSKNYVAYSFKEVKGYSKFGSYTGNANTDGTFIYLGFRPAWFLVKNTAASENWRIYDNKRDTFNHMYHVLFPNQSSAESTVNNASEEIDFLSNGVKIRSSAAQLNGSGNTLFYMAFAENPLVGTNGIPTTAK